MDFTGLHLVVRKGEPDKPAFVFVHGLGMNRDIWSRPGDARLMGGLLPVRILLRGFSDPRSLFHDVTALGCTAVTWSQRRPVGPVAEAIEELDAVVDEALRIPCSSLVLVGHSRGGLIARAARILQGRETTGGPRVAGLVAICSPHAGTGMAQWARTLSPGVSALKGLLPDEDGSSLPAAFNRSLGFITCEGAQEMLPDSEFLRSLPTSAPEGVACFSVGATNPSIFRSRILSLPEGLARMFPNGVVPEELIRDRGDGLVSAKSAVLPFAKQHMDFPLNHLNILVAPEVREALLDIFKTEFNI